MDLNCRNEYMRLLNWQPAPTQTNPWAPDDALGQRFNILEQIDLKAKACWNVWYSHQPWHWRLRYQLWKVPALILVWTQREGRRLRLMVLLAAGSSRFWDYLRQEEEY